MWIIAYRFAEACAVIGNLGATPLLSGLAGRMGKHGRTRLLPMPNAGRTLPEVRLSDHSPVWDHDYDAVMVTDTSYMRNPTYHQMSDTIASLDHSILAAVTKGLDAALHVL